MQTNNLLLRELENLVINNQVVELPSLDVKIIPGDS